MKSNSNQTALKQFIQTNQRIEEILLQAFPFSKPTQRCPYNVKALQGHHAAEYRLDLNRKTEEIAFDPRRFNEHDLTSTVFHENVHRLDLWTRAAHSSAGFYEVVDNICNSRQITSLDKVRRNTSRFLESIMTETLGCYVEMLLTSKEEAVWGLTEDYLIKYAKVKDFFLMKNDPRGEQLDSLICNLQKKQPDKLQNITYTIGALLAGTIYDEIGHDLETGNRIIILFTHYDPIKVTSNGYDPNKKYREIFSELFNSQ